jgi:hypothetical protein
MVHLRNPLPLGTHALTSDAAHDHGLARREKGYTPAMMVAESRMLQVSIFHALQQNLKRLDTAVLLTDVMAIADEVDSQLAQAMTSLRPGGRSRRRTNRAMNPKTIWKLWTKTSIATFRSEHRSAAFMISSNDVGLRKGKDDAQDHSCR